MIIIIILEMQQNTTEMPSTTQDISTIIDTIDNLIINNKVQMIDISEIDVDPNEQDQNFHQVYLFEAYLYPQLSLIINIIYFSLTLLNTFN